MNDREDRNRRLLRARDLIDRRYADPLDVTRLARTALMGRAHFIREFKDCFGETPYRYLQRRRVERAMSLLQWTPDSITDICLQVGFSSLGTFSRTFSAIVGCSPSEFRRTADRPDRYVPTSFAMRWNRPAS